MARPALAAPIEQALFVEEGGLRVRQVSLLRAYGLSAQAGDTPATSWIQVAVTGDYEDSRYGAFSITKADLKTMLSNFQDGKHPIPPTRLCMDYDHLTLSPSAPGDGKAAGWFKAVELRNRQTELWAEVEWTEAGAGAIAAKEYLFVSPTFSRAYKDLHGDELGCTLLGAAVTNLPFLQGMAELSLSAVTRPAVASRKTAALSGKHHVDFSFGETGQRVQAALEVHLGLGEWTVWVVDMFDAYVVYRYDGHTYRIDYTIGDNGAVTFTGVPAEVVTTYEPLAMSRAKQEATMAGTIKLTAVGGTQVDISAEAFMAAVELLPEVVALRAKAQTAAAQETTIAALSADVKTAQDTLGALQTQIADKDANADVDGLIKANKIKPADREEWLELRKKDAGLFTKLTAKLAATATPVKPGSPEHGSGGEGAVDDNPQAELEAAIATLRTATPALTHEAAQALAFSADRTKGGNLYDRYRAATQLKVSGK